MSPARDRMFRALWLIPLGITMIVLGASNPVVEAAGSAITMLALIWALVLGVLVAAGPFKRGSDWAPRGGGGRLVLVGVLLLAAGIAIMAALGATNDEMADGYTPSETAIALGTTWGLAFVVAGVTRWIGSRQGAREKTGQGVSHPGVPTPPPPPAGWYDPGGVQRYWDGNAWNDVTSAQPPV